LSTPVEPERGFRAALQRLGLGLLSLPSAAIVSLIAGWSYLMYWALTMPSEELDSINYLKSWVNDLGHAPLFGLWVLWMLPLLRRSGDWIEVGPRAWAGFLSLALAGGAASEWLQGTITGRTAAWGDVVTDVVGVASVLWIASYLGTSGASEAGTRSRLVRALLACGTAALLATLTV